jgi:hypothetical protein
MCAACRAAVRLPIERAQACLLCRRAYPARFWQVNEGRATAAVGPLGEAGEGEEGDSPGPSERGVGPGARHIPEAAEGAEDESEESEEEGEEGEEEEEGDDEGGTPGVDGEVEEEEGEGGSESSTPGVDSGTTSPGR